MIREPARSRVAPLCNEVGEGFAPIRSADRPRDSLSFTQFSIWPGAISAKPPIIQRTYRMAKGRKQSVWHLTRGAKTRGQTMPAGRPSLYDPQYCDEVIRMGKEGYSVVEMAAEIGVCRNTLETNWPAAHPEFLEAFTHATLCSQAWWERAGRVGMIENNISAPIWSRSMAARFPRDWREVKGTELTGKDGGPVETAITKIERVIIDPTDI